jgi:hypothetical protein
LDSFKISFNTCSSFSNYIDFFLFKGSGKFKNKLPILF